MTKKISYIFVVSAALLWGSTASVVKLLITDLANLQVLFYSSLFAFLGLFVLVLFQNKKAIIQSYTKEDYFTFSWMGFFGVFLYTFFLYEALKLLSGQEAFTLNYLWPIIIVVLAGFFLKEQITFRKILGIACSFFGIVIVITKGNFLTLQFSNILGILSAIAGAFAYGLFGVLGKKQHYDKTVSMMFYYFFALIYALIAVLTFSWIPMISIQQLLGLLWLGVFTCGFAFLFWFLALEHGDTAKMSGMILLTPFISLVYIYFLLGEKILPSSLIGLLAIIVGVLIQSIKKD